MSTEIDKDELVGKMEIVHYLCQAGEIDLGPLDSVPQIESNVETSPIALYEAYGEEVASFLTKNETTVTITTRNVAQAMALLSTFKKGDNIFDSSKSVILNLVPIGTDGLAITFPNAYLNPGLSVTLGEDGKTPNAIQLVYDCKVNDDGQSFTYTSASSSNDDDTDDVI